MRYSVNIVIRWNDVCRWYIQSYPEGSTHTKKGVLRMESVSSESS